MVIRYALAAAAIVCAVATVRSPNLDAADTTDPLDRNSRGSRVIPLDRQGGDRTDDVAIGRAALGSVPAASSVAAKGAPIVRGADAACGSVPRLRPPR